MKIHFICLGSFHFASFLCMLAYFLGEKCLVSKMVRKKTFFFLKFTSDFDPYVSVCLPDTKPEFWGRGRKVNLFMNNFFHLKPWTSAHQSVPDAARKPL